MKFQVICLLIYGIRNSFQLHGNFCYNKRTGSTFCCFNHEWIYPMCKQCKNGTTTTVDGGRCVPCKDIMYGLKCLHKCDCNSFERKMFCGALGRSKSYQAYISLEYKTPLLKCRCDPEIGCILTTSISTITSTNTETTVLVQFPNETVTEKQTIFIKKGGSIKEWIMYTLCISGLTILTVVGHLLHKKRKQQSLKLKINEEVVMESFQPTPCIGIYCEVDENPLIFDTTELNVASQPSFRKSVNFISQGRQSILTEIEDEKSTGYLDVYFAVENDGSKIDNQIVHTDSLSNNSFNSDFARHDNAEYCKPYTIHQNSCQENSNACEVIVTVHQCSENASPLKKEAISNVYPHMFQPIQTDKQIQRQANENMLSPKINTVNEPALQEANPSVDKTCNLQDCTKFVKSEKTIDSVCVIDSNEDKSLDVEKSKTL